MSEGDAGPIGMRASSRFRLIPAVYLVLRRGGDVLLSRRYGTGYQDGRYSLVAGHLDGDELATQAVCREALEEAGITVASEDLELVHVTHRLGHSSSDERIDLFFSCRRWAGQIRNAEPEKCDGLHWFPLSDLPGATLPLVRHVLGHIQADVPYSEHRTEPR